MNSRLEEFRYDDAIVRKFLFATVIWGVVGMLVGIIIALQLCIPSLNFGSWAEGWLSFGRLRPLHTNAVIFAFAGNAIFTGVYYSSQRLLKTRMFSDLLSNLNFWGWQLIIVLAAVTLPAGITQSREYAELEWPIDILITLVWVVFGLNLFGTIARRRERHLYVAIWFYIATVVTIALLHIFNNLVVPATALRSYSIYAGAQDAFMQWWYGHNAVAFFLTTPFLGLMYYFMPKAAERPVFSYRLSILHFWTLIFIYIWAGPHHLHYTAIPAWASTLGMLFSVMLWMPSWGGMINGLLTLRGAWHKVAEDPILKFFVVAVTFYGMSTFEGPMLSVKSVNMLSHYNDWTIAHVHAGSLGWVGFMTFGTVYWLLPRLFQTPLFSRKLMEIHFWIGTLGILFYIVPIYVAGITQGLMWFAFNDDGTLRYEFVETTQKLVYFYWARVGGGLLYFTGAILCLVNVVRTWLRRPKAYEDPIVRAAPLTSDYVDAPAPVSPLRASGTHVAPVAYRIEALIRAAWHRRWERLSLLFTVMVAIAVISASLFEIVPLFIAKAGLTEEQRIQRPYSPLELAGRDIYIQNGCYNCHSQMIRPIWAEVRRYGEYSKPGEFVYDHPFQWGSRRIGPDLARVGSTGRRPSLWHVQHMEDPRQVVDGSIMPAYAWLLTKELDFDDIQNSVAAMVTLGVPYDRARTEAADMARQQAQQIADEIVEQSKDPSWSRLVDKQIIALIAYLQRLGQDLERAPDEGGDK